MVKIKLKKIVIYALVLAMCTTCLYGCNKEGDNAEEPNQVTDDQALEDAVATALGDNPASNNEGATPNASGARAENPDDEQAPVPKGERSPVEITRVEMPDDYDDETDDNKEEEKDPHEHEPTPNLFEIDECLVEINGIYKVKLAQDLLKEINSRRKEYGIGPLKQNTSLMACADARCKEQSYFVGHFRPNGTSFDTVGRPYVQGECIAVDYRTVKDIMESWFSVNKSRMEIMNPDYTQCGISVYDIDNIYYIAAEFGY